MSSSSSSILNQAVNLKNQGKYNEAEPLYYQAISADPKDHECYYSLAKFYYMVNDRYHSILNYLRAGHLSILGGIAQEISGNSDYKIMKQSILRQYPRDAVNKLHKIHEYAPLILLDFNLLHHLGHTLIDPQADILQDQRVRKMIAPYIRLYKNRFSDPHAYRRREESIENEFYNPISIGFLIDNIQWNMLESENVINIYVDENPKYQMAFDIQNAKFNKCAVCGETAMDSETNQYLTAGISDFNEYNPKDVKDIQNQEEEIKVLLANGHTLHPDALQAFGNVYCYWLEASQPGEIITCSRECAIEYSHKNNIYLIRFSDQLGIAPQQANFDEYAKRNKLQKYLERTNQVI